MDKGIHYLKVMPENCHLHLESMITCYRDVFATDPWFEWKQCSKCGKTWGREHEQELGSLGFHHCGEPVVDFWPTETVRRDLLHEISTDMASCWIALIDNNVVGFTWGYGIAPTALEKKLALPGLAKAVKSALGNHAVVAYQDELGVLSAHRGKKISKELFKLRFADFLAMNLNVGVIRTKDEPPSVTYLWFTKKLGYQLLCRYEDDPAHRVVLGRSYEGLAQLF